ncbi:MAG TPA: hypothetical protein VMR43_05815 [Variovorax sp.]|nr:hypothetical protein [Variovorax sp.]
MSGVPVPPQVTLSGPAASETVVGVAEQYRVRIQVAADAQGTVDVAISDRGLATEDIRLMVEAKPR